MSNQPLGWIHETGEDGYDGYDGVDVKMSVQLKKLRRGL